MLTHFGYTYICVGKFYSDNTNKNKQIFFANILKSKINLFICYIGKNCLESRFYHDEGNRRQLYLHFYIHF